LTDSTSLAPASAAAGEAIGLLDNSLEKRCAAWMHKSEEREAQIAGLQENLTWAEGQHQAWKQTAERLNAEALALRGEIETARSSITAMQATIAWRLAERLRRRFPPDTTAGRWLRGLPRAAKRLMGKDPA
jgi:hypothetical protein